MTDSDGAFRLDGLLCPKIYSIEATALSYGKTNKSLYYAVYGQSHGLNTETIVASETENVADLGIFQLPGSSLSLSGVYVNAKGIPIANHEVQMTEQRQSESRYCVTDGQGKFRFENLSEGVVELKFKHPESSRWSSRKLATAGDNNIRIVNMQDNTSISPVLNKEVENIQSGGLEVTVIDPKTGEKILDNRVTVFVKQEQGNRIHSDLDKKGLCRFSLGQGVHVVNAGLYPMYESEEIEVKIENGKTTKLEIELIAVPEIFLWAIDTEGNAVADAKVYLLPCSFTTANRRETLADGSFHGYWKTYNPYEEAVPLIQIYEPEQKLCGYASVETNNEELKIVLQPEGIVELAIVNEAGDSVGNHIGVRVGADNWKRKHEADLGNNKRVKFVEKLDGGRFRISGLAELPDGYFYFITLRGRSFMQKEIKLEAKDFKPGEITKVNIKVEETKGR